MKIFHVSWDFGFQRRSFHVETFKLTVVSRLVRQWKWTLRLQMQIEGEHVFLWFWHFKNFIGHSVRISHSWLQYGKLALNQKEEPRRLKEPANFHWQNRKTSHLNFSSQPPNLFYFIQFYQKRNRSKIRLNCNLSCFAMAYARRMHELWFTWSRNFVSKLLINQFACIWNHTNIAHRKYRIGSFFRSI